MTFSLSLVSAPGFNRSFLSTLNLENVMQSKRKIMFTIVLLTGYFFIFSTTYMESIKAAENRFTILVDGTVKDHKSKLIWAPRDNGSSINWYSAMTYCKEYSFGGHRDWRMPTSAELATLYSSNPQIQGQDYKNTIDVATKFIEITGSWVWTNKKMAHHKAMAYGFNSGKIKRSHRESEGNHRALPVRSRP